MISKEDVKFEIDQLRKDKIIYAIESVACTLASVAFMILISLVKPTNVVVLFKLSASIALVYWLFTVFGNTSRLIKIKKLEKILKGKNG